MRQATLAHLSKVNFCYRMHIQKRLIKFYHYIRDGVFKSVPNTSQMKRFSKKLVFPKKYKKKPKVSR